MAISVENSSPAMLLRAFPNRANAEDLVRHGRVRLGSILSYRTIEDEKRRDPTEGEVKLQEVRERAEANNPFDFKRELKSPNPVRELARSIIPQYQKAVTRGRACSFGQEWQSLTP